METFPRYGLRRFIDVDRGSVCAAVRSGHLVIGLVVSDWQGTGAKCWILFSEGAGDGRWTVQLIDFESTESVYVLEGARLVVDGKTTGTGQSSDPKLAGSAFLIGGKIAISGLVDGGYGRVFNAEDGSYVRPTTDALPYFLSWKIQVPDGVAIWMDIFSR